MHANEHVIETCMNVRAGISFLVECNVIGGACVDVCVCVWANK